LNRTSARFATPCVKNLGRTMLAKLDACKLAEYGEDD
jgi:hypothetical protein